MYGGPMLAERRSSLKPALIQDTIGETPGLYPMAYVLSQSHALLVQALPDLAPCLDYVFLDNHMSLLSRFALLPLLISFLLEVERLQQVQVHMIGLLQMHFGLWGPMRLREHIGLRALLKEVLILLLI